MSLTDGIKNAASSVGNVLGDYTPVGRMIKHDESLFEAFKNAKEKRWNLLRNCVKH